jgi:hypothetical protein
VTNVKKAEVALNELKYPPELGVLEVTVHNYVDSDNEDALRINVIINDKIDAEKIDGETVVQVRMLIRDRLIEEGFELFPYVSFIKRAS